MGLGPAIPVWCSRDARTDVESYWASQHIVIGESMMAQFAPVVEELTGR
jgi:hypothetical protein